MICSLSHGVYLFDPPVVRAIKCVLMRRCNRLAKPLSKSHSPRLELFGSLYHHLVSLSTSIGCLTGCNCAFQIFECFRLSTQWPVVALSALLVAAVSIWYIEFENILFHWLSLSLVRIFFLKRFGTQRHRRTLLASLPLKRVRFHLTLLLQFLSYDRKHSKL